MTGSIPKKILNTYSALTFKNIVSCSAPAATTLSEEFLNYDNVVDVVFSSGRAHRWVEMFGDWYFAAHVCKDGTVEILW